MVESSSRDTLERNFDQLECRPSDYNVASKGKEAELSPRASLSDAMRLGRGGKQTNTERQPSGQHTVAVKSLV